MKKLIYLVLFTLFVASCSNDKPAPMSSTLTPNPNARFATNAQDLQAILNEATTTNTVENIYIMNEVKGNFTSNMKWKHPSRNMEISGGAIDGSLTRITPKDMSEAVNGQDNFYRYSINIHDVLFKGAGNGLSINCMYSPIIYNCQFEYKDTGLIGTFALNALIQQNRFTNCKMVASCFKSGVGTISGAGLSTSASNNCRFIGNRVFNANNAFAAYVTIACSGVVYMDNISEGGTPMYHFYNDGQNNTTSWYYTAIRNHIESKATISSFYSKERQCMHLFQNNYFQYPSVMYDINSYAGSNQVTVDQMTWIPTGSTMTSTGNVRWRFTNLYPNLDITDAKYWKGGVYPSVIYQEKLINTGLEVKQFINGKIKV
jgi:hypothetical protein